MIKLAIIHTTASTVESLNSLAGEMIPDCEVVNFVDDSILPQLLENGGNLDLVKERLVSYAIYAQDVGADIILEACSSVGELVSEMESAVDIQVVRIDEAMAEEAIRRASNIGVAATISTTLNPTKRLLSEKAQIQDKHINLQSRLIDDAFNCLKQGDLEKHDRLLIEELSALAEQVEVMVLAQASMARVVPELSPDVQEKFLSSPRLAMRRICDLVKGL